jgi:hypothetical protein
MMASSGWMRDLGRWMLVGLAAAVATVAAIGYALIATDAVPTRGDLGTFDVPEESGAQAVFLSDGRPAFLVRRGDEVHVVDARQPLAAGTPGRLVLWCGGGFTDLVGGAYTADGRLLVGDVPSSLVAYPVTVVPSGRQVVVGPDGAPAAPAVGEPSMIDCDASNAVNHEPSEGEVFDPSVAADEEPPGWIWLEGRLLAVGGQAVLCDGGGADCATGAVVRGTDPAGVGIEAGLPHLFLGRVRDGAIEELFFVPSMESGG